MYICILEYVHKITNSYSYNSRHDCLKQTWQNDIKFLSQIKKEKERDSKSKLHPPPPHSPRALEIPRENSIPITLDDVNNGEQTSERVIYFSEEIRSSHRLTHFCILPSILTVEHSAPAPAPSNTRTNHRPFAHVYPYLRASKRLSASSQRGIFSDSRPKQESNGR